MKSSRSSSVSPSSSPRTIPASTAWRSPSRPGAIARATCARRRSERPPMPPRRPTIRQSRPCRTTWTPRRASQPRSSKPSSGPRGAATVARSSSTAPWGGERPSGSSSSTRSRSRRSSKRRTSAGSRSANVDRRTGPVTTAVTAAERPISGVSTLASRASSRTLPHHQPASASASAQAGSRALGIVAAPSSQRDEHDRTRRRRTNRVRQGQPDARREHEQCRPGALDQGNTTSRSCSTRAGPMPGIASRSSTERKPPCSAR